MTRQDFATLTLLGWLALATMLLVARCDARAAPPTIGPLEAPEVVEEPPEADTGLCDPTVAESRIIADARCSLAGPRRLRADVALAMLRVEERAGIPTELRGLTLATWCAEAAWGVGDEVCRSGPCDGGRARGPLQLHAGYARLCAGLPYAGSATPEVDAIRDDPELAAECYLAQVVRVAKKSPSSCRWTFAEAWVARGRRPESCEVVSGHVRRLRLDIKNRHADNVSP